ncbi:Bacterial capsule synthesis protein PGA_cap [Slackia heliotrinireducens]|uniref:Bacterial capsule synthesis protein PGA_cap n=1 Tax=Slackia heliotrinireducens (strain ATCC 29202 / DSM 20476 / NCTC 11029 / RHS 1) TaxID=471855 RepID=C7N0X6_SLAHD|nr:CapA family protein [Slackia heliotrinireducens]ACV21204.1 Bacterial capsule synthesis protein PGA_cap [Slackia heliotrinireducens DSM 20476]VEG98638.1 Bacterial capsule synthesis protein PGA_cap [Slackia heliotrinireducens]
MKDVISRTVVAAISVAFVIVMGITLHDCVSDNDIYPVSGSVFGSSHGILNSDVSDAPAEAEEEAAEPESNRFSNKLDGATETVDENGVVHGTTESGINYTVLGRDTKAASEDKVTLCAVGDQIGSDNSLAIADAYAGDYGDGLYDFLPFYREVAPYIDTFDLRYINQETVMAGTDQFAIAGWPSFNSPDNEAAVINTLGFNLVNFCTNHLYDCGAYGIERSHQVWANYPELLIGGSYLTQEDRETVHMIERNGITFAFLAYCYADNSYYTNPEDMPNNYYECVFDKDLMHADIARAQEVADVVIVSMHWGDEYSTEINSQQLEYAKFLADEDVDLVIGTHAHSIQPAEYVTGDSGNTIPVVYGLSDFVSGWTITNTIISGIFTCDFVPQEDGTVAVQNCMWHPTIEWSNGGDTWVRFAANMGEEESNENVHSQEYDDYNYIRDFTNAVMTDENIPVDWEEVSPAGGSDRLSSNEADTQQLTLVDSTEEDVEATADESTEAEAA